MSGIGDRALLLRIVFAGVVLVLLLVSLLTPEAKAQAVKPMLASELLLRRDTPALRFRFSLPAEAALEPVLARALRRDAQGWLWRADANANTGLAEARKQGWPERRAEWRQIWSAALETPELLVLSATTYSYTGGAHGNPGFASAIFDRKAKRRIEVAQLFVDPAAAMKALTPEWCNLADAERRKRRGTESNASFGDCPALAQQVLVPVGYPDGPASALRVLVGPYVLGPYSEGSWEIDLPAALVLPHLKPQYQSAFAKP